MASLAVIATVLVVSTVIKHGLVQAMLEEEAVHYWDLYATSAAQPPPIPITCAVTWCCAGSPN